MQGYNLSDTIFAPITAVGIGSVTVFRISGKNAIQLIDYINQSKLEHRKTVFTNLLDANHNLLDECVVTYFQSPKSFTGEDCIEISIHASLYIAEKLTTLLSTALGFRHAMPGEFLYRATIYGKTTVTKAESINSLIKSQTKAQHDIAIRGMGLEVQEIYQNWHNKLVEILTLLEANIDFSDQDIPNETLNAISRDITHLALEIKSHLDMKGISKIQDGIDIAILGLPNAGKSSIMNAICNKKVSITSNIAGTTRDLISARVIIGSHLVNILDTAGIRSDADDAIEAEGIKMAQEAAERADLRILIFELGDIKGDLYNNFFQPGDIVVASKSDLIAEKLEDSNILRVSIYNPDSIRKLVNKIQSAIEAKLPKVQDLIFTSQRQLHALEKLSTELNNLDITDNAEIISESIRYMLNCVGEIFGNVTNDDILGNIFGKFCIGK